MKKYYLILCGLLLLATACNPSGNEDVGILPTLVPVVVPIEEGNALTAVDADTNSEEVAAMAASEQENEEPTASELEDDANEDDGPASTILDDIVLFHEPPNTSYLTTLVYYMTVTNDDGSTSQVGRVEAEGARTVTPDASSMVFNMADGAASGGLGETMTIVQIEDAFYALTPPNECFSVAGQSGFENPFALFLDTGGFLTGNAERVLPNETINGVESRHYIIDRANFADLSVDEVYDADLYVAEEGDFITKLLINGFGVNDLLAGNQQVAGEIYYELNYIPQDDLPTITPPAGCDQPNSIASEYPTLPDAVSIVSAEGIYTYETQSSFDDVVQFYKIEMIKDNEWTLSQEFVQPPSALLTFTGTNGTVLVTVDPGQTGVTQVAILPTQ